MMKLPHLALAALAACCLPQCGLAQDPGGESPTSLLRLLQEDEKDELKRIEDANLEGADASSVDRPEEFVPAPGRNQPNGGEPIHGAKLLGFGAIGDIAVDISPAADANGNDTLPDNLAKQLIANDEIIHYATNMGPRPDMKNFVTPGIFCHRPLYFEEKGLERFGHSKGPTQPLVSGARFAYNVVALPYKMTLEPPRQCQYYHYPYESGGIAPHFFGGDRLDVGAGIVEAAAIITLIALFP